MIFYRSTIFRFLKIRVLLLATTVLLVACARPPSATVGEGGAPFHVDKDVAFRTTYYFRVFDYCVARKLKNRKFEEVVVPLTDSLYRFRMTGKANTLISDVKFESGTLKTWEIDPFGAKVEYDPESRRVRVISPREVAADARRAAIMRDFREILSLYDQLSKRRLVNNKIATTPKPSVPSTPNEKIQGKNKNKEETIPGKVLTALETELQRKIEQLGRIPSGPNDDDFQSTTRARIPLSDEQKSALLKNEVKKVVAAMLPEAGEETIKSIVNAGFGVGSSTLDRSDPGRPGFVERATGVTIRKALLNKKLVQDSKAQSILKAFKDGNEVDNNIASLMKTVSARLKQSERYLWERFAQGGQPPSIQCPKDAPVRRGFQVLGPEGWRTFDQDERLLLAMSASAQPLISTLKDLSNRVLNARDNPEAELLPIAQEQKRLAQSERELDRQRRTEEAPEKLAEAICKTLVENESRKTEICSE